MSTYARLQISGSGAFDEPNNGIDIYPTENPVSGKPRTTIVRIPGKKGGVHQHGGLDNAKIFLRGVAYGDETVRDSKETGLENLGWHTGTLAWRGRPITLSVVYRESGPEDIKSASNPGFEIWDGPTDSADWIDYSIGGAVVRSSDPFQGSYAARLDAITGSAQTRCYQIIPVNEDGVYTFSAVMKSTEVWLWWMKVYWMDAYDEGIGGGGSLITDSEIHTDSMATTSWTTYSATHSPPAGATWMQVEFLADNGGTTTGSVWTDEVTVSGDDTVAGYTKSYAVQLDNYNVKTRRGTDNIHDVRVNLTEWTD